MLSLSLYTQRTENREQTSMKMGVLYDQLVRVISIMEFSSVILYSRMFILLLVILLVTELTSATSSPRVIIVGAGMSGITAAKTLSENGIKDFLILEATDRIGGRMHKTNFQGLTIEMGANWVEGVGGPKINPIWELANKVKLRNFYSDLNNVSFNFYDQYGHLLPDSVASAVFDQFDAASDHAATLSRSLNANEEDDVSILTSQRLFGDIPSTPVQMAIDYYNYDYEFAEPPRVTSLQSTVPLPTFRNFGEDTHFVADSRGYEYIVHYLAQQFLKSEKETIVDDRLQLNKVVREINHTAKGVTVRTEDGGVYNAKYAMVSVSLGVLQSNLIKFQPDLPHWKLLPLFEFDMAIYTKIFMKFPHKFWPTGNGTEFFIYADEKRGYYPIWQQMEMEYPGSNILMVTVTDDESRRIEQQSDHQTQAEIMTVLRKIFGKQIPEPEAILVPRWWSDRLYRGTFSNWPIGVTRHEFDELRAPVGSVYFTGEHTSEFYNGYVHGAYFSGIDSANMLVDCIKKGKCHQRPHDVMDKKNKRKRGQCKGACCSQIQREREVMRQTWMKKINALEKIIEVTNHTKP